MKLRPPALPASCPRAGRCRLVGVALGALLIACAALAQDIVFRPQPWPRPGGIVASSSTITVTGTVTHISGTTTINTITPMPAGTVATLVFDGVLTVGDLTGNVNLNIALVSTANDTLTVASDGASWFEVARSIN